MARRKLMPGKLKMWGLDIAVDWAEPKGMLSILLSIVGIKIQT